MGEFDRLRRDVDPAGELSVGPESAGTDFGLACFDRSGKQPTLTPLVQGSIIRGQRYGGINYSDSMVS